MTFQTPSASREIYELSVFPQTIRDWNDLLDSLVSSDEVSDDYVPTFTCLKSLVMKRKHLQTNTIRLQIIDNKIITPLFPTKLINQLKRTTYI